MKPTSLSTPRSSFPFYPFPASYSFLLSFSGNEAYPRGYPIRRMHRLFNPPSLIKDQKSPPSFRGKITKSNFNSIKSPGCRQSSIPIPARVILRFSFYFLFTTHPSSFILHKSAFPMPLFVFSRFQKKCTLFVPHSFFSNNEPPTRRSCPQCHPRTPYPDHLITCLPDYLITFYLLSTLSSLLSILHSSTLKGTLCPNKSSSIIRKIYEPYSKYKRKFSR
jgi:hypothetical protein